MEEEFVQLAVIDLNVFPPIKVDKEDNSQKVYRIDVLWWYLHELKTPGHPLVGLNICLNSLNCC